MRGGITRANFKKIKEKFPGKLKEWEDAVEMWMDLKKVFTKADKKILKTTVVTTEGVQVPIADWIENSFNKLATKRDSILKDLKKFREEQEDKNKPLPEDLQQRLTDWKIEQEELSMMIAEVISYTTKKEEEEEDEEDEEDEDEEDEDEEEDNYDGIIKIFNIYEGDEEEEEEEEDEDEEERVSFPPQQSRFGSGLRRRKFVDRTVYFPG